MKNRKPAYGRWVLAAALIAAAIAAGVYFARQRDAERPASREPAGTDAVTGREDATAIRHPIEQAQTGPPPEASGPLPALADSDKPLLEALGALLGGETLTLLNPQYLVQRTVATLDNLPRARLTRQMLPVKPLASPFEVSEADGRTLIAQDNSTRYAPYVRVAEAVDAKALVAVYVRFYPLFQQAYRELGYEDRYFNDRLIEVIDHLLEAPEVTGPIDLVRTERGYAYVDPELQSRSVGQKALIRIGNENATKVKAKLREIREALTAQSPRT